VQFNQDAFTITRIDPADVSDDDLKALTKLINTVTKVQTLRQVLEQEIDKLFNYILGQSLHD
jgi:hypothetical protein